MTFDRHATTRVGPPLLSSSIASGMPTLRFNRFFYLGIAADRSEGAVVAGRFGPSPGLIPCRHSTHDGPTRHLYGVFPLHCSAGQEALGAPPRALCGAASSATAPTKNVFISYNPDTADVDLLLAASLRAPRTRPQKPCKDLAKPKNGVSYPEIQISVSSRRVLTRCQLDTQRLQICRTAMKTRRPCGAPALPGGRQRPGTIRRRPRRRISGVQCGIPRDSKKTPAAARN